MVRFEMRCFHQQVERRQLKPGGYVCMECYILSAVLNCVSTLNLLNNNQNMFYNLQEII